MRKAGVKATKDGLTLAGKVDFPLHGAGGVSFCGEVRLLPEGGTVSTTDTTVTIEGADALTIIIDVRTDYNNKDYMQLCAATVDKAAGKGYGALRKCPRGRLYGTLRAHGHIPWRWRRQPVAH